MNTTKILLLAGFTALSLGAGTAMAQESAGGYIAGPFDQQSISAPRAPRAGGAALILNQAPQYGAADHAVSGNWAVPQGSDN